jgi:hypothetical protein
LLHGQELAAAQDAHRLAEAHVVPASTSYLDGAFVASLLRPLARRRLITF